MGDRKVVAVYLCFRTLNAKKDTHASHFFPLHVASGQCAACLIMKMRSNEDVELERLERLAATLAVRPETARARLLALFERRSVGCVRRDRAAAARRVVLQRVNASSLLRRQRRDIPGLLALVPLW